MGVNTGLQHVTPVKREKRTVYMAQPSILRGPIYVYTGSPVQANGTNGAKAREKQEVLLACLIIIVAICISVRY